MNVLNKTKDDLSNEMMVQLAIVLDAVYAAEIIAYRVAMTMDNNDIVDSLFQKRKQCFRQARQDIEKVIHNLEISFDHTFDDIIGRENGEELMRADLLLARANDVVQLLNIYNCRCDGDWDKRDKMKKALLNFKPNPEIDLESIRKYYNFKW